MIRALFRPFPREERFINSLNIGLIQRLLWPLLGVFLLLSFSDTLTTPLAYASAGGFVELNPFAARMFQLGFWGFLFAYAAKYVPAVPLFYISAIRTQNGRYGFQVRLLKFTAMVVLLGGDVYLGSIVLGNNLPNLLRWLATRPP